MAKGCKKNKILILFAIALVVIGVIIAIKFFYKEPTENVSENTNTDSQEIVNEIVNENELQVDIKETEVTDINETTQISGYKVIGRIKIDKINLEDVILEETTDTSLDIGLTKFWGPEMNEIGNFSITGHNYRTSRSPLFSQLDKVEVGDTFTLQDLSDRTITYKVYDKYTVEPEDTTPINQNKDGKREVTLITCTKGATHRIILKARELI